MTAIRRFAASGLWVVCGRARTVGVLLLVAVLLPPACTSDGETDRARLPNPASVHCEEHGGRVEIVEDPDGSQRGQCVFPDSSRCDEWAFYHGRCAPGDHPS
ncbi:MAG TPA: DUF333 domain-containing protein [Euzebyales bacterium]|nr:DUF333 domain-containing protein [Euzebyales bacterium]